jgi:hypothetical protein
MAAVAAVMTILAAIVTVGASPAKASTPQPTMCWYDMAIYSRAAGKYVSAEAGWSGDAYGTLRARANTIGPWERYDICFYSYYGNGGTMSIYSHATGRYVSAELGWSGARYGTLRARTQFAQSWERFWLWPSN